MTTKNTLKLLALAIGLYACNGQPKDNQSPPLTKEQQDSANYVQQKAKEDSLMLKDKKGTDKATQEDADMKKTILTASKGVYYLESFDGFEGANSMFDAHKTKGKWIYNFSMNQGGTRQGDSTVLNAADNKLLNSIRIELDETLATRLMVGSTKLFESPFVPYGMDYRTTPHTKSADKTPGVQGELEELTPTTIFNNKQLVLLAMDKVDLTKTIKGNFEFLNADHLFLTFDNLTQTFSLNIMGEMGGDNETLVFKRK
jgi:hypothetical protein